MEEVEAAVAVVAVVEVVEVVEVVVMEGEVVGMEVGQPLSVAQHLEMVEEEVAGPLLQQILVVRRQQLRVVVEELETVVEVRPQLQHTLAAQQQPQEVEEEEEEEVQL